MKRSITLMALLGFMLFSCKKNDTDAAPVSIAGTWEMIHVKDITANASQTKPASEKGDVIISFIPDDPYTGVFSGKTPRNVFGPNVYSLGSSQTLSMPVMTMTKVSETPWGELFVDHIREARQYSVVRGTQLNIRTDRRTLTFKKQ